MSIGDGGKLREFDLLVAGYTGIRSPARTVLIDEFPDDNLAEGGPAVLNDMFDPEPLADLLRAQDRFLAAAGLGCPLRADGAASLNVTPITR